ncbi:MAG: EI24 domain-containing protein [Geminicoccaceae bacterium]
MKLGHRVAWRLAAACPYLGKPRAGSPLLKALILSIRQLSDPAIRRVLVRCVLLAVATFVLLVAAVGLGLGALDPTGLAWLDGTLAVLGSLGALVLAWLLFPIVIVVSLGLFADEVIEAVERRYYPDLPPAPGMGTAQSTWGAIRFTMVALALNLLVLPLYLLPGANVILYLALNGYLLGREYFEQVAQRRLAWRSIAQLRRSARARLWWAGVWIAGLLTVPVLNLIAPVIATCFMVHLFEGLCRRAGAAQGLRVGAAG